MTTHRSELYAQGTPAGGAPIEVTEITRVGPDAEYRRESPPGTIVEGPRLATIDEAQGLIELEALESREQVWSDFVGAVGALPGAAAARAPLLRLIDVLRQRLGQPS